MWKRASQAATAVLGAIVAAYIYSGLVLDVSRADGLDWAAVVEGLLTGVAVLAVWRFVRSRSAAAAALAAMVGLVLFGVQGTLAPAQVVAGSPMSWAVMPTLAVRLAVPTTDDATRDRQENVPA